MSTKAERADQTRRHLIATARELFGQRGFAAVGTEEIVTTAGVTRGALYHHFADKRALFRAVHEQLEEELVEQIATTLAEVEDPLEALEVGVGAVLDACEDQPRVRITLLDAPTVLGWSQWREIDELHGLGLVYAVLAQAMDAGVIATQPIRPLAHLLLGAIGEAALLVANADDRVAARAEVEPAMVALVRGLRAVRPTP